MTTHTATLRAKWNGVPKGTRLRILARENLRGIPVAYAAREDGARLPSPHGGTERYARIGLNFLAMDKEY